MSVSPSRKNQLGLEWGRKKRKGKKKITYPGWWAWSVHPARRRKEASEAWRLDGQDAGQKTGVEGPAHALAPGVRQAAEAKARHGCQTQVGRGSQVNLRMLHLLWSGPQGERGLSGIPFLWGSGGGTTPWSSSVQRDYSQPSASGVLWSIVRAFFRAYCDQRILGVLAVQRHAGSSPFAVMPKERQKENMNFVATVVWYYWPRKQIKWQIDFGFN